MYRVSKNAGDALLNRLPFDVESFRPVFLVSGALFFLALLYVSEPVRSTFWRNRKFFQCTALVAYVPANEHTGAILTVFVSHIFH